MVTLVGFLSFISLILFIIIKEIKGIKSDIDLKEQEARIAKLQKEAEADTDKNDSVSITIEGGDDEWQN